MEQTVTMDGAELTLALSLADDRPARIVALGTPAPDNAADAPAQPLVELLAVGHGRAHMNTTHHNTLVGQRLRPVSHSVREVGDWCVLEVVQRDAATGLVVTSHLRSARGAAALQAWTTVHNDGAERVVLEAVSSLALGSFLRPGEALADVSHLTGRSTWVGEARYRLEDLGADDALVDLDLPRHQDQDRRDAVVLGSAGSWSSATWMPSGALLHRPSGRALAWQVEHNGSWTVELSERTTPEHRELTFLATGPTDEHEWRHVLEPGATMTSVPVSVAVADGGTDGAFAELTRHRRRLLDERRPGPLPMPVVFNDYMNTLMGDPTTDKLLPLVDAAAEAGAEYFCIDAGWYAQDGGWWSTVGEWEPATWRFPGGLEEVLAHIRSRGMVPGLWLEPEVIGVDSPLAATLPDEAFLRREGVRIVEHGRHLLDLRDPSARKHLDSVVDRLVDDLGAGFFKLDYNVTPGRGVDGPASSPGGNLLGHQQAVLDWLDDLAARHPQVLLESCASGGMRQDFATVSRCNVQSTSDQQDFLRYPPIAAASMLTLLPEQAGIWAYPQAEMDSDEMAFTLAGALLGRLYLSGHLDLMQPHQRELVREAVAAHRSLRDLLPETVPVLPWGAPGWTDPWVCLALRGREETLLTLWRRPGADSTATVPLPWLAGAETSVETVFPVVSDDPWTTDWSPGAGELRVHTPATTPQARVLRIRQA
ncbi:alpha-galactosidase [Phycicoccus sp. BSK3Z-2]|uniref:Alpha-galactosidase n=1 Tax=Phycicoccus avicenniae TaxID=2828860 RepID=A0A941D8Y0_9MICO|nr:glycoside hydrolase family 36 protein [Phycicoccus avicenniae]MBR7742047.1 alpha-galactosidase [Phycicoccus avicenniae]